MKLKSPLKGKVFKMIRDWCTRWRDRRTVWLWDNEEGKLGAQGKQDLMWLLGPGRVSLCIFSWDLQNNHWRSLSREMVIILSWKYALGCIVIDDFFFKVFKIKKEKILRRIPRRGTRKDFRQKYHWNLMHRHWRADWRQI